MRYIEEAFNDGYKAGEKAGRQIWRFLFFTSCFVFGVIMTLQYLWFNI